jgi:hypothetical protein
VMASCRTGIGDAIAAYLEVERESGARELREKVLAAGIGAKAETESLLEIEETLEGLTRARLGGTPLEAKPALEKVRARLAADVRATR